MFLAAYANAWERRAPLPHGRWLYGLVWTQNRFVGVGERGSILSTKDGVSWEDHSQDFPGTFVNVRLEHEKLFAFGTSSTGNGVFTSSDGIQWKPVPALQFEQARELQDVCWTGGAYLAFGYDAISQQSLLASSPDGLTWQIRALPFRIALKRVAQGGGTIVAIGRDNLGIEAVLTSHDSGASWVRSPVPRYNTLLCDVAFASDRFIVVGGDSASLSGSIFISLDGTTWSDKTPQPLNERLEKIIHDGTQFVALGGKGTIYFSGDGADWRSSSIPLPPEVIFPSFLAIGHSSAGFLAAGINGLTFNSTDGRRWRRTDFGPTLNLGPVAFGAGQFIIASSGGSALTSRNGIVWNVRPSATSRSLFSIIFTGTAFVGVGQQRLFARSTDGISWQEGILPVGGPFASFSQIAFGNGTLVAVGDDGAIAVSNDDGLSWQRANSPTSATLLRVAFGNGRFVALGYSGLALVSQEGRNWSRSDTGQGHTFLPRALTFFKGAFVAAGSNGILLTSNDGVAWSRRDVPWTGDANAATVNGEELFVLIAGNPIEAPRFYSSPDGIRWTLVDEIRGANNLTSLAFGAGRWVAAGESAQIFTKTPPSGRSRIVNFSALGSVSRGPLILGTVSRSEKNFIFRAAGPALRRFDVANAIVHPLIDLYAGRGERIDSQRDMQLWRPIGETLETASTRVGAFALTAGDAATKQRLNPGCYTMIVRSADEDGSFALAELYDGDDPPSAANSLVNVSARGTLNQNAPVLVAGLVIEGVANSPLAVLVRAVGPGLDQFKNITGVPRPQLRKVSFNGRDFALASDSDAETCSFFAASGGAFPVTESDRQMILTLAPGAYTFSISDSNGREGEVLFELYLIE